MGYRARLKQKYPLKAMLHPYKEKPGSKSVNTSDNLKILDIFVLNPMP